MKNIEKYFLACVISIPLVVASMSKKPDFVVRTSLYQSIYSDNLLSQDTILVKKFEASAPPMFIVESGNLYLRFQTTWSDGLAVHVGRDHWTPDMLNQLIEKHPEIENLLPKKNNETEFSIKWIKCCRPN